MKRHSSSLAFRKCELKPLWKINSRHFLCKTNADSIATRGQTLPRNHTLAHPKMVGVPHRTIRNSPKLEAPRMPTNVRRDTCGVHSHHGWPYSATGVHCPRLPPPWGENLKSPDAQRARQRCTLHGPVYKTCITIGVAGVGTVVSLWGREGDSSGGWRRCV